MRIRALLASTAVVGVMLLGIAGPAHGRGGEEDPQGQ